MLDFISFLRQGQLEALTREYLGRVHGLKLSLMDLFKHVPEEHLLKLSMASLDKLLGEMQEGRAFASSTENLKKWEADELPSIPRDAIEPSDLVILSAVQKDAILSFLPRFTRDPDRIVQITLELGELYMHSQADVFQQFTRIRVDHARQMALREAEIIRTSADRIHALNDELMAQKDEAQEANRLKSQFLANMSHELRTPLNSILGYTELVLKSKKAQLDERSIANLNVVKKNGKHLLTLINEILDLAKVEAGKATVYVEAVDPRVILQSVFATAEPLATVKGVKLTGDVASELRIVVTDGLKVQQILLNLVSNAIKFTGDGYVYVRVDVRGDDRWVIEVEDSGIGIAPEHQRLIFEEFRQVDASATRVVGGTGLGLAIARKMAQLLGGDIQLHSEVGRGSLFTLELPLDTQKTQAIVQQDPPSLVRADQTVALLGGKLPVVTIDDDPEMLHLIAERLKDSPYVAIPASTGDSGLQLIRELKPYAITLDVILPHKDGWSILRELKNDPAIAGIPVLILSVADNKMLGYALGASGYLTKPVDQSELLAALDRFTGPARLGTGYVLVVEDDVDTRKLYRQILERDSLRMIEACDGKEAMAMVQDETPAIVILDLMMPHVDGFQLMRWLRDHPLAADVPIIVVTAKDLTGQDLALLASAQSVICKGEFTEVRLIEELGRLIAPTAHAIEVLQ